MSEGTGAHIGRRFIDVSHLPTYAFGHRSTLWWGVWMLIAIEGMMFSLLATSYFYLRGNYGKWPPTGVVQAPLWLSAATVALLVASAWPMYLAYRAAFNGRLRQVQTGLLWVTIVSAAAAAARGWEIASLGYRWNSHAYGSVVWALYFMHTFHVVAGLVENAVLTTLMYRGPVEKRHMLDVRLAAYYWWFVVTGWVVLWAIVISDEVFFRNSFIA